MLHKSEKYPEWFVVLKGNFELIALKVVLKRIVCIIGDEIRWRRLAPIKDNLLFIKCSNGA